MPTTPVIDRDLVVRLTRDLIRFPSVNPPGDEGPVAEYLAREMRALDLEAEVQQVAPGRANVIGRLRGTGEGHLVLTGHLDVVPPGEQPWRHDPFAADLVDGRIYGRGSADMKGGVAAMVGAMAALRRSGFTPKAEVILAATCGEEAGMLGAGAMVERRALAGSRYLVVGEPSGLDVFIAEKGVLWVELRALGRTAHGSMPWLGINAVSYLARLIPRLEAYPFAYAESDLLGKPSLSVNAMHGGAKTNVVPDVARASLDLRTVPSQRHDQILAQLQTLADDLAREYHPDLRVEIAVENDKGPVETDRDEPLVAAVIDAVTATRGTMPEVGGVTYGTDAAALGPGFGIPMVICGPGAPGMAHQPDEYVSVDELTQAAAIYVRTAIALLG